MSKELTFTWNRDGAEGDVSAVSFPQALDRAKVQFLKKRGCGPGTAKFRINKEELRDRFFKIGLSPLTFQRYKELYLGFKEDQLSPADLEELAQFQSFYKARSAYEHEYKR